MRRQSSDSQKEPKGILKTSSKYGIPTSPSSNSLNIKTQSKYESILKQHGNDVLKKEREIRSLQQQSLKKSNQNNSSLNNKPNTSICSSASKISQYNSQKQFINMPQQQMQILHNLNSSSENQRRSSRLNDQILETSEGSRHNAGQSPLNVNSSHIMNNSMHRGNNIQNKISNQSHSPHQNHLMSSAGRGMLSAETAINSMLNQITLKDLCPEDKRKVGQLMKKLAEEKQEKDMLKQKLQMNQNQFNERINHIQKQNQSIFENSQVLKDKFQHSVKLLQNYRDRSNERSHQGIQQQSYQGGQYTTPQHKYDYDNNQNQQQNNQQESHKQLLINNKIQQYPIRDQDKQRSSQQIQNNINMSYDDIPVSSQANISDRDDTNQINQQAHQQQYFKQAKTSADQQIGQSISNQATKLDQNIDDDKLSRYSRQSNKETKSQQQVINNPHPHLFNSKQSTISNNMYINNNNNNNNNSSRNQQQLKQGTLIQDSLDQDVQDFLTQSIPANRRITETEQINRVDPQNYQNSMRNSKSPIYSNPKSLLNSVGGFPINFVTNNFGQQQQYQNFMPNTSNPYPNQQNQTAHTSFAQYVYKNGRNDKQNQQAISNNDLLKQRSVPKYSLSPHQQPQTSNKSYCYYTNEYKQHNEQGGNNNFYLKGNEQKQQQQERVTLRMNTGESEKIFNQWRRKHTSNSVDKTIKNSPYKNEIQNQKIQQIENDDNTRTFQEIQNLRSQMQNLVTSLKQISINKEKEQQDKQPAQNSNSKTKINQISTDGEKVTQKQLQGDIYSISTRQVDSRQSESGITNRISNRVIRSGLTNRDSDVHKNGNKSTISSKKENRINDSNLENETFSAVPKVSHQLSQNYSRQSHKQNTMHNKGNNMKNNTLIKQNSSEANSSEDDDQIDIAEKFLNIKKQKLLSHLQDIRKDDFLDSSSFEQSHQFDKTHHSYKNLNKNYDLPLQIIKSENTSNKYVKSPFQIQNSSKQLKQSHPHLNEGKIYFTSLLTHHQFGNSLQLIINQNQNITSSNMSSPHPKLHPDIVKTDSNRGQMSHTDTLTRITSRNTINCYGGEILNPQIQSVINQSEAVENRQINVDKMSKEEIKMLNRLLESKLKEMSENVSYDISSQNNELDASENTGTQQMLITHHINSPQRQSQNTFDISSTQLQIHSLKDSELLKYSLHTQNTVPGTNNKAIIQKSQTPPSIIHRDYYNPQNHNIHNNSQILGRKNSKRNLEHHHREQTNADEYVTFRHEAQERGDTKRTVEYNNRRTNNAANTYKQKGLDESQGTEGVSVSDNYSYLSTPQPEKLRVDYTSTTKRDHQGNNMYPQHGQSQLQSSAEQVECILSYKQQEKSDGYIKVEDGKGKKHSQNDQSDKQGILSKIQQLSEDEMVQVLEALKQKKYLNKRKQQSVQQEDNQATYNDISGDQRDFECYSQKNQQGITKASRLNQRTSYNQNEQFIHQSEHSQPSKLTTIQQSNDSVDDVLGINDLIQNPPLSKNPVLEQSSSTFQNQKDYSKNRINKNKQKQIECKSKNKNDIDYDESLFQNIETIEKQDNSKRSTLSAKTSKEPIERKDNQQDRTKNNYKQLVDEQEYHVPKHYSHSHNNIDPKEGYQKYSAPLYKSDRENKERQFESNLPRRIVDLSKKSYDNQYNSSSYTETDQSLKYIKKKINNQI